MNETRKIVTITDSYYEITKIVSLTVDQIKLLEYLNKRGFFNDNVTFEIQNEPIEEI